MSATLYDIVYTIDPGTPVVLTYRYGKEYVDNIMFMFKNVLDNMADRVEVDGNQLIFPDGKAFKEYCIATSIPEVNHTIISISAVGGQLFISVE